jgi:hypothetical protein
MNFTGAYLSLAISLLSELGGILLQATFHPPQAGGVIYDPRWVSSPFASLKVRLRGGCNYGSKERIRNKCSNIYAKFESQDCQDDTGRYIRSRS